MSNIIKVLFKQSFLYSIGSSALQLASFLLVPLYARYLTPSEFGVQALFVILISILSLSIDLGIKSSISRVYYDYTTDLEKRIFTGNAFAFTNILGIIIIAICFAFDRQATVFLTGSDRYVLIYRYVLYDIFFTNSFQIYLAFLRVRNKPYKYIAFSVGKLIAILLLTIYYVAVKKQGLTGLFKASAFASLILYLITLPLVMRGSKLSANTKMLKNMIAFGLPFVPAGIFSFIITSSDRYILKLFSDLQEVGQYAMGYKFGLIINVFIVQPFVLAWPQQIVPISMKENANDIFSKIITYYIAISVLITTILLVFLDNAYALLLTPEYFRSITVVPFVAISYICNGLYYIFLVGVFLRKKTIYPPLIFAFGSLLNLGLNLYFIPKWGMLGAAITTLIAYSSIPILTYFISNRFYKMKLEYIRILKIIIVFVITYFITSFIPFHSGYKEMVLKATILLFSPLFLYLVNFFEEKEKREIRGIFLKLRKAMC